MSDYAVINPATGETVAEYPTITDSELADAIAGAAAAQKEWARTPVAERAKVIARVAELHTERRRCRRSSTTPAFPPGSTPTSSPPMTRSRR